MIEIIPQVIAFLRNPRALLLLSIPVLPVTHVSVVAERDLFGAEPFDPFSCGAGDFPPDIQSKLDEMQKMFVDSETLNIVHSVIDPIVKQF
ncbi:hypothetical protein EK904_002406 [Melospiza melodia maxima]|nr:hypothetical protein EK904_002406 [Melospiza melodia maxima]